jgi:hypothetical protein
MEDSEWAHKGSRWCCKVDACTSFYVFKWCYVNIWSKHTPFKCKPKDHGVHLLFLGGPRQQDHGSMNVHILSNSHVRQKRNEKKAFDRMKKRRN